MPSSFQAIKVYNKSIQFKDPVSQKVEDSFRLFSQLVPACLHSENNKDNHQNRKKCFVHDQKQKTYSETDGKIEDCKYRFIYSEKCPMYFRFHAETQ